VFSCKYIGKMNRLFFIILDILFDVKFGVFKRTIGPAINARSSAANACIARDKRGTRARRMISRASLSLSLSLPLSQLAVNIAGDAFSRL